MKTAISLFAGAGLSSLGYERAGFQVRTAVEFSSLIASSYAQNHPVTRMLIQDVSTVSGKQLMKAANIKAGELDLLDSSPPCQNWSLIGHRKFDRLVWEPLWLAQEIKPKAFVLENVEGIALGEAKPVAYSLLMNLRKLGYQADARRLGCFRYGVPQARVRFYLIGVRNDVWNGKEFFPKPDKRTTNVSSVMGMPVGRTPRKAAAYIEALQPDEPAPTVLASANHQWYGAQMLTVEQQARIQGIPENYVLNGKPGERQTQIGNAVPPEMARRVGVSILMAMKSPERG